MARNSPDIGRPGDPARLHEQLVQNLLNADAYPHPVTAPRVIDTHISSVILTGEFVYKLKKPVRLPFVDFSTLERRQHFCREELRLNRRLAPELYLDVVPIGGSPAEPRIGATPAIDYAVKQKQFDPQMTADRAVVAGQLGRGTVEQLAETIARFHADAEPVAAPDAGRIAVQNISELGSALRAAGLADGLDDLRTATSADAEKLAGFFAARERAGAIRDGHGDLHLANIALVAGRAVPFDALEFDPVLRAADVMDETAFVAMDLIAHARPDLAFAFLTRYLETTGDYEGIPGLRFYLRHRALVRAKVRALKSAQTGGDHAHEAVAAYLATARRLGRARRPRLILMYGLSGSGKTTVSGALVTALPSLRIRSDLERKRLHGVRASTPHRVAVDAGYYGAQATEQTYRALETAAAAALAAHQDIIVDASFLSRARRQRFRSLARRADADCVMVVCTAPIEVLRQRVMAREAAGADASDATLEVLEAQRQRAEPPDREECSAIVEVDTRAPLDADALTKAVNAASRRTR